MKATAFEGGCLYDAVRLRAAGMLLPHH